MIKAVRSDEFLNPLDGWGLFLWQNTIYLNNFRFQNYKNKSHFGKKMSSGSTLRMDRFCRHMNISSTSWLPWRIRNLHLIFVRKITLFCTSFVSRKYHFCTENRFVCEVTPAIKKKFVSREKCSQIHNKCWVEKRMWYVKSVFLLLLWKVEENNRIASVWKYRPNKNVLA